MNIIKLMLLMMGIRVQKPVRRVGIKRSLFFTLMCKMLAKNGKRRSRKTGMKFKKSGRSNKFKGSARKTTYSRR